VVSTVQRYYASTYGRFNTADPLAASAMADDPGSWNRYAYVGGDPANHSDPSGQDPNCGPNMIWDGEGCTDGSGTEEPSGSGDGSVGDEYSGLNPCVQIYSALFGGSANCGAPVTTVGYTPPPPNMQWGGRPISKSYSTGVIPCSESASQVIGTIENNFPSFGNFQGPILGGLATVP